MMSLVSNCLFLDFRPTLDLPSALMSIHGKSLATEMPGRIKSSGRDVGGKKWRRSQLSGFPAFYRNGQNGRGEGREFLISLPSLFLTFIVVSLVVSI